MASCHESCLSGEIHFHLKVHVAFDESIAWWALFTRFQKLEGNSIVSHFFFNCISLIGGVGLFINPEGFFHGSG